MSTNTVDRMQESELADMVQSGAPIGYGIVQPGGYVRDGVPVIAIRDLPHPSMRDVHRSAPAVEAAYRRSRVVGDDLLISVKGTTGRIGLVPSAFVGNISRDVARIRFNSDHVPAYWFQVLQSPRAQQILQQATVGSTRQELSIGTLKTLSFRFPSRAEQERIAVVLSAVDDLIATLQRVLVKKQAVLHGMRRELLTGQTHLPGFAEPWRVSSVAELATITKGQQLSRVDMDANQAVPVWNGGTSPSGYTSEPNTTGSVVTVSEGGNSCGWVGRQVRPFWLGGHCYALEPQGDLCSVSFLYHALKLREPQLMALRVGSGLPNIQTKRLARFQLKVPSDPNEAEVIASCLDDALAEVDVLRSRIEKERSLKQAVLQELLIEETKPVRGATT